MQINISVNRPFSVLMATILFASCTSRFRRFPFTQLSADKKNKPTSPVFLRRFLSIALRILLLTIFASLARAHERVRVQNVRDFPQTKLDSEINAPFLLNEHGDPRFFFLFFFRYLLRTVW